MKVMWVILNTAKDAIVELFETDSADSKVHWDKFYKHRPGCVFCARPAPSWSKHKREWYYNYFYWHDEAMWGTGEPDEGTNYELGLKGEFYDGRLNSSLAYFEVHQDNRPEADMAYNGNPTNPDIDYAYKGIKATTKGYEAEISGELMPGWQLQAGYTHKVSRDQGGTKVSTWEPEDQINLYTSYKLTGDLDKLTLGGGVRWQSTGWQMLTNWNKGGTVQDGLPYTLIVTDAP